VVVQSFRSSEGFLTSVRNDSPMSGKNDDGRGDRTPSDADNILPERLECFERLERLELLADYKSRVFGANNSSSGIFLSANPCSWR